MEPDQKLHPHHPIRYVLVIAFLAMILISTEQAGQSEMVQRAAQEATLWHRAAEIASQTNQEISLFAEPITLAETQDTTAGETLSSEAEIHLAFPEIIRGIYISGWSAGSTKTMERLYQLIDETEINAVIIDIKDASGKLSYQPRDPDLQMTGVGTNRIKDISTLIAELHRRQVYVIGRVQVFQDPFFASLYPHEAFRDTRTGGLWRDYKGIAWLRPNSERVWEYLLQISRDAHGHGFDEINLDYVRFPSDGELAFLDKSDQTQSRAETIGRFFATIGPVLKEEGMIVSADLFGLTMSASDDLGIGQKLELIAPHVDVIAPMVYPSHFASGAYGIGLPAEHPSEIIHESLSRGVKKLEAIGLGKEKLRPWLQDFNLGAIYSPELVRAQIDASEAVGITSWMLWDPRNSYTREALTQAQN